MKSLTLFRETISTYQRHGWQLCSVLLRPETRDALSMDEMTATFAPAPVRVTDIDAVWFQRESGAHNRTAYELRLIADNPYALFEIFEPDEEEEDRADVRREMEARMSDRVNARHDATT
jgi:hypothetical protein